MLRAWRRAGAPIAGSSTFWSHFYDAPLLQSLTYGPGHMAVLRGLRRAAHARVLDVGCGTGLLAARMRQELPGAYVVGCGLSHGMLARALRHRRVEGLVQGSALALSLCDASFEARATETISATRTFGRSARAPALIASAPIRWPQLEVVAHPYTSCPRWSSWRNDGGEKSRASSMTRKRSRASALTPPCPDVGVAEGPN